MIEVSGPITKTVPGPLVPIRVLRKAKGWTMTDLAGRMAELGVSRDPSTLYNIEAGRIRGSAEVMRAWALALLIDPEEVVPGELLPRPSKAVA